MWAWVDDLALFYLLDAPIGEKIKMKNINR